MLKEEYDRYKEYHNTNFGLLDLGFLHGSIRQASNDNPMELVSLELGNDEPVIFLRSQHRSWSTVPWALDMINTLEKKQASHMVEAMMAAKPFQWALSGSKTRVFSNISSVGHLRPLPESTSHSAPLVSAIAEEYQRIGAMSWDGIFQGSNTSNGMERRAVKVDHYYTALKESRSAFIEIVRKEEPELVFQSETPVPFESLSTEHDGKYVLVNLDGLGELGGSEWFLVYSASEINNPTGFDHTTKIREKIFISNRATFIRATNTIGSFGQHVQIENSGEIGELLFNIRDKLRSTGLTTRDDVYLSLANSSTDTFSVYPRQFPGEQKARVEMGTPRLAVLPYAGPGYGYVSVVARDVSFTFITEGTFERGHDWLVVAGTATHEARTLNSAYRGGAVSNVTFYADEYEKWHDMVSNGETESSFVSPDPLSKPNYPTPQEFRAALKSYNFGGTVSGCVGWDVVDRLIRPDNGKTYLPINGFLHGGDIAFFLTGIDQSSKVLLSTVKEEEGNEVPHDVEIETIGLDTESEEDLNNPPLFGQGTSGPNSEPGAVSPVLLVGSRITASTTKYLGAVRGDDLLAIAKGQGVFKPSGEKERSSYQKLSSELGGRKVAFVGYADPVKIPYDMVSRMEIYRQYKRAREKACLSNDFMKKEYAKGVTWGAVNNKLNSQGSTHFVCSFDHIGDIQISSPLAATKVVYVVGTAPAQLNVTYTDGSVVRYGRDEEEMVWEAIATGGVLSGITMEALNTSWGYDAGNVTNADLGETKKVAAQLEAMRSDNYAASGAAPLQFDPGAFMVAGFPDVKEMTSQDAYKIIVASVILYEGIGASLIDDIFGAARRATPAYRIRSQRELARLEAKFYPKNKAN